PRLDHHPARRRGHRRGGRAGAACDVLSPRLPRRTAPQPAAYAPRPPPQGGRRGAAVSGARIAVPGPLPPAEHPAHPVELGLEGVLVVRVLLPPGHAEAGGELTMRRLDAAAPLLAHEHLARRRRTES